MLSKRSRPIFKKPLLLLSGDRKGLLNPDSGMSSPRTPLGLSIKPPRGWEMRDHEGVGLGIVAAMSSKAGNSLRIPVKDQVGGFVKVVNLVSGSNPIPISPLRKGEEQRSIIVAEDDEMELDCFSESEDYTCVISHDPLCRKKIVYYDGRGKRGVLDERAKEWEVFVSPQMTFRDNFPMSDFLKFCHLCRKILHGEDIYMYRGEKAFCSMECRYMQMVSDECTDKCGPEVSNPSTSAASPHSGDKIFFTGIVAA